MTQEAALQEFTFETVTVNERGEITSRRRLAARQFVEPLNAGVALEMVHIPGGLYVMGSPAGSGYADEHPQHSVRVAPFLMGKYPLTQDQWFAVMGRHLPYRSQGGSHPVDRVSWEATQQFCQKLAQKTGRAYRLASEAEWEYACRAGSQSPFCCGPTITTDLANYVGEYIFRSEPTGIYRHGSTPVGSFPPNDFGLYDMHGNVWEWCQDGWHPTYEGAPSDGAAWEAPSNASRVLRGGCWHDPPDLCRSAARLNHNPREGEDYFSFRLALSSLEPDQALLEQSAPSARRITSRIIGRMGH